MLHEFISCHWFYCFSNFFLIFHTYDTISIKIIYTKGIRRFNISCGLFSHCTVHIEVVVERHGFILAWTKGIKYFGIKLNLTFETGITSRLTIFFFSFKYLNTLQIRSPNGLSFSSSVELRTLSQDIFACRFCASLLGSMLENLEKAFSTSPRDRYVSSVYSSSSSLENAPLFCPILNYLILTLTFIV